MAAGWLWAETICADQPGIDNAGVWRGRRRAEGRADKRRSRRGRQEGGGKRDKAGIRPAPAEHAELLLWREVHAGVELEGGVPVLEVAHHRGQGVRGDDADLAGGGLGFRV